MCSVQEKKSDNLGTMFAACTSSAMVSEIVLTSLPFEADEAWLPEMSR
jgi:hypothetical protein